MNRLLQVSIVIGGLGLISSPAWADEPLTELRPLDLKSSESVLVSPLEQTSTLEANNESSLDLDFQLPRVASTDQESKAKAPLRVAAKGPQLGTGPQLGSARSIPVESSAAGSVNVTDSADLTDSYDLVAEQKLGSTASPQLDANDHENDQRLRKVRRVLDVYRPKLLNTGTHGPWETMHAIIAYGVDTKIRRDGPHGQPVTAIGWLAFNQPAAGQKLFYARRDGLGALTGPGLQGHEAQFLAIVAQCRLDRDYPIHADGKEFSIKDLIKFEQLTCKPRSELTFKLIGLAHYLDSDASWTSEDGQQWDIQRLIREELAQPINGVACGGTHRLFGLSYAVYQRAKQGKPMVGEFARAKKFISDYQKYTYALQNADGSFSTEWFKGREARNDVDRRMQTTGHILEWMIFSSPAEDLEDPRLTKAVDYLAYILLANASRDWAIGPRGHAINAMKLYDTRLSYHLKPSAPESLLTDRDTSSESESASETSDPDEESVSITLDTPFAPAATSSTAK